MGQGGGWWDGKNSRNLSHLNISINYRCFHASSSRTLTITLLLANRVLYFGPFRGEMKIQIALTIVVLGYLKIHDIGTRLSPFRLRRPKNFKMGPF